MAHHTKAMWPGRIWSLMDLKSLIAKIDVLEKVEAKQAQARVGQTLSLAEGPLSPFGLVFHVLISASMYCVVMWDLLVLAHLDG